MATEADIPLPVPVCEARGEQVVVKICVSEDDKQNEVPIVEGENFLKSASTDGVHCNVTPAEESQQNGDSIGSSVGITPDLKVGDVTQLSSSDHHSSTENDSKPCISELNVQSKPTGEDMSSNLTNEMTSALEDNFNTTSEDHGVASLSESHGDVECHSKTLENAATDADKFEESSPVQVEDSQIERDEHFEEESEKLPLTLVKDLKDAENTSTLVKEDVHKENPAESSENIDLSQENSVKGPPEKQSRNLTLHEEATIDADDRHKESLETIVSSSHEEGSMNAVVHDSTDGNIIDEVDNHKEVVEKLSSGEGNCEVNSVSPEKTVKDGSDTLVDRPVELATDAKEIQRNAEESNSSDKDGGRDTDSSETKMGDTLVDHSINDAEVVSQLCKDTSSDRHATNDSSHNNVALAEEILHETESHAPCISQVEEPTVQVKTTDDKSVDEKPTEENIWCNQVSKEGESDHNKMGLENETTTTLETCNSDELQSNSDLNSSLSKEEETAVQKSKEPVTMPEDYGVPSEKTLSESHGDVECQFQTLEDSANEPKLADKSEESQDSQIDHNEHLEEEGQGLPLTETSLNDVVSPATDEIKEAESEQSTKCTLVKEDAQRENPAESLHVALENIQVSNASTKTNLHGSTIEAEEATIDATEENKDTHESFPPIVSGSPKEGSMNAVLQEVTSDYTDGKINDEVDKHEEVSENLSTTEGNSLIKLEGSENKEEDDSGKESGETPLAREVNDASMFLHEDGQPKKAEFCDTESMLTKTESKTENTEDVHINSEDTKAPESVDKRSGGGTIDAAAEKEETVENVPTIVQNEKTEENSFIQVAGQETENEEHLDKENEQASISDYTVNANNDEEPSGAELFEKDKSIQNVLLTEQVQSEKHEESALEDIKTSHTEATGILEEQIPAERIHSDETGIDANEKTQELQNVLNEDSDKDLLIKVAASEMTHDINLEEEPDRPSLTETSKNEASDKDLILLEPKTSDEYPSKVELPNDEKSRDCTTPKKQDHKTSTSSADIETTCSLEEQSLEDNSQTVISNKITDAADKKDLALEDENVATETPHEHIEEKVDCSAREHEERLEEDNQNSLIEAPEETDAREAKNINEPENRGEESITPELENGENTESTCETDVEKHIDSLEVKPEDIIQHDSSPDINKSIEEEPSHTDSQEISTDKAERESVDAAHTNEESVETEDVAKDIPDCVKEDSMPIEEVGSQNPLNEASEESPKVTEGCLIMKEEALKSLQVAAQDIETPPLSRDRETSYVDEESPTTDPEAIMHDNKEEIPDNATGEGDQTPTDKDIGKDIMGFGKEDDMPIEEVGSQKPLNEALSGNANIEESTKITQGSLIEEEAYLESLQETAQEIETPHLSLEREISSPDEQSPIASPEGIRDDNKEKIADSETGLAGETPKDMQNITPCDDKEENMQVQEDCSRQEQNESENIPALEAPTVSHTESSPVKEEEKVEMPQILTADPQETCDETQKKTDKNNDAVISVSNGNTPIEVDGLQEPSSEEVPAEKLNDDKPTTTHEAKFAYEDEEKIECAPVKEQVHIESLQVADEVIKDTCSGQDRDASHLEEQAPTTDSHETMDDEKFLETLDSTDLTLEDKKYADEDTKEDSRNQVDGLLLEQEEHSVKVSESTSLSDAPKDDITVVKEGAEVEDPIDSSQVATEDIKAFAPCQDTETSSTVEQVLDPEDISSNEITEKIVDAIGEETQEAQDIAKSVPQEDDSQNEQNSEATLIKEDVSTELPQIASEDREEPCLSEVRETNSQEEQILCASPGVRINDNEEDKTIDPTVFENETPKDEVPKEMESVDVKGETKEEEGFKATVTVASNQERSLNLTAEETPCAEDLAVNKDVIGHIPVVSNYREQDSPVIKVSEEHMMTSSEHSTSMESDKTNEQLVGEENTCDKADLEKIQVLNDARETLAEIDSRGCTETAVQVSNAEKEAQLFKQDAENDQKNINKTLLNCAASEDVSDSKEVNGEEQIDSNNCKAISSSSISVASEEVSTSKVALEEDLTSYSVTHLETKNEEEAPAIKETTPSCSKSAEENSNYIGSLTQEKLDSNEVAFTSGECESNNRGLESIAQGQSFDIILKTEEEHLKAEAGTQFHKDVREEILQEETSCEKEIIKDDISSEKEQLPRIKEEHEDIKDYHQGSCEDEVITDSHQEDEVKQDQQLNSKETYEFTNNENDTKTVPEDLEEKIVTNEATDNILHQEEQATSIEEPTTIIDNENADISCMKTDTKDSNKEAVQIAIIPGRESEEQNKEDEMCRSDEVQAKDEEKLILSESKEAYVEADKFDVISQTKDISECAISEEDSEKEENYPKEITDCQGISVKEEASEEQEAEGGIDLGATGLESQELEELNDKCRETTAVKTSGEVEAKDEDTQVKMAEKDDAVNLQSEEHNPKAIQNAAVSVTEEEKVGRDGVDAHEEELHQSCVEDDKTSEKEKDKHYVDTRNLISKVEEEEEECGNKEMEGKPERSLADNDDDEEEESDQHTKSEAPVMVDIGDADIKVAHKKSHNILSGVGSKVKHSIAKVKKAITGKSPSPKKPLK